MPLLQLDSSGSARSCLIWPQLTLGLEERILSNLDSNDIACSIRLLKRDAAAHFSGPQHTRVQLSRPSPPAEFAARWGRPGAMRSLSLKQRRRLLCLTAATGVIANLEIAVAAAGCTLTSKVLEAAAAAGKLEACVWLRERGCPWDSDVLCAACGAGRLHIYLWLVQQGCPTSPFSGGAVLCAAARGGHLSVCEQLLREESNGRDIVHAASCAARAGHVEVMDRLLAEAGDAAVSRRTELVASAAEGCDLATLRRLQGAHPVQPGCVGPTAAAAASPTPDWREKLQWLASIGYPVTGHTVSGAARCPDALDRLQWLHGRGIDLRLQPQEAADAAAYQGRLDVLRFLLEQGVAPTAGALQGIAAAGHTDVLAFLRERGFEITAELLPRAVCGGHVAAVRWLLEALGPGVVAADPGLMRAAAQSRSESVEGLLTVLREHGCPWGTGVAAMMAAVGSEAALEWLAERGCPFESQACLLAACRLGNLAAVVCLRRLGCEWDESVFPRAPQQNAPLPVLAWLLEQGCPVDWEATLAAAGESAAGEWIRRKALGHA